MATTKGPIYLTKDSSTNQALLNQLKDAVLVLEDAMIASIPITKGEEDVGFGVSKAQRGIAADFVVSIAKVIKNLKGW